MHWSRSRDQSSRRGDDARDDGNQGGKGGGNRKHVPNHSAAYGISALPVGEAASRSARGGGGVGRKGEGDASCVEARQPRRSAQGDVRRKVGQIFPAANYLVTDVRLSLS